MNIPESYTPILAHLSEALPEVKILAQQVESGEITQNEAMTRLITLSSDPRVSDMLKDSVESFLPSISDLAQSDLFQPDPDRKAKLNPLYMREIAERLQFDSDIPELRTGYLAEGTKPQIPVDTDAMNPVALGMMLESASEDVLEKMKQHLVEMEHKSGQIKLEDLSEDSEEITDLASLDSQHSNPFVAAQLINRRKTTGIIRAENLPSADPDVYKRGRMPASVSVATPKGANLATMSEDQRQKMAWGFISTTAGRRTGIPIISRMVVKAFSRSGIKARSVNQKPEGDALASHEWLISIADGPETLQSNFSPLVAAETTFSTILIKSVTPASCGEKFLVWVNSVDTITDREVGWEAQLYFDKEESQ